MMCGFVSDFHQRALCVGVRAHPPPPSFLELRTTPLQGAACLSVHQLTDIWLVPLAF